MSLRSVGRLIAERRRAKGFTLQELAATARIGRSTLAALEAGQLLELGFAKVERLCTALDLTLAAREPELAAPLMPHRHLTESAGRTLTKAAIEDILVRGDFSSWRSLVRVSREDVSGRIARRVREVASAVGKSDPKAHAFAVLLPELLCQQHSPESQHG
ncbi:MAG: helix-turn-helix domain-containing protein [Gammaproteobacteria bacterium]